MVDPDRIRRNALSTQEAAVVAAELKRLRAVASRVPKTADDVPVMLRDYVYTLAGTKCVVSYDYENEEYDAIVLGGTCRVCGQAEPCVRVYLGDCYSTPHAAEAARKAKE
jgi:hypothetical protein